MKEIPDIKDPEEYAAFDICDSAFVKLTDGEEFDIKMQYPMQDLRFAEANCYIREEVYDKLLKVKENLPKGIRLRILDAWRPFALQKELYDKYSEGIISRFSLQNVCAKERERVIAQYISFPKEDSLLAPVHTTGGAVDVTLIDENGKELNMGTEFDDFSVNACTAYYENGQNTEVRDNRRILYWAMRKAGFTNLPSEWWHYDYGDKFWGFYNKKPIIYSGVFKRTGVKVNDCREQKK